MFAPLFVYGFLTVLRCACVNREFDFLDMFFQRFAFWAQARENVSLVDRYARQRL
jgi:hypothetical protein